MYLKAIELENFKSFVHKNRIDFKQGFTAISGPNGSGKSNIGDAILFVLGPKSSKVIRASKLVDLIYDGGKKGKPADYCRVSLIFDNSDRVLPVDSNEVRLTRYIKRTNKEQGYNSYFYINDESARLQDFVSLLEHAKISADGYNFVKQGDVTRIVEMTPVERRGILDEISGIAEFDKSIYRAEIKKKVVEENMEKIEVLMEELRSRLKVLEEDRRAALRYKELEEKLKETRAKIAYAKMHRSRSEVEAYTRQIENIAEEIETLRNELEKNSAEVEKLKKEREEVERRIGELGGEELKKIYDKIDNLKLEMARIKTRIENREEKIEENKKRIAELKKEYKNLNNEIATSEKTLKEREIYLAEKERILSEKNALLREMEENISEANEKFRKMSEEVERVSEEIDKKKEIFNTRRIEFNRESEKLQALRRELAKMEEEKKAVEESIKDAEWRIKDIRSKSSSLNSKRNKLNQEYMELKNRRTRLQKELEKKQKEIDELRARYERLRGKMESKGIGSAVDAVLSARDRGLLKGIHGTIAELGSVDEEYELAIQVAAGGRLNSIICEDDLAAAKAIEFLKKNHLGRAIFLPLNKMIPNRPRGKAILASKDKDAVGFAIDLIDFDKRYEAAFWYVFGDTVIVKNLDAARRLMGGVRLVTLDGQLIEASGAMVGGSVEKRKGMSMGNLKEIREKLEEYNAERDSIMAELERIDAKIEVLMRDLGEMGSVNTEDLELWSRERDRQKMRLAKILSNIGEIKREIDEREKLVKGLNDEIERLSAEISNLESKKSTMKKELDNLVPQRISEEIKNMRAEISDLSNDIAKTREEIVRLGEFIKSREETMGRINKEIDAQNIEIEHMLKKNDEDRKAYELSRMERAKYEEIVKSEEGKIRELTQERDKLTREINELEKQMETIKGDIRVKEETKITLNTRANEYASRYEDYRREYESYGVKVERIESVSKLQSLASEYSAQMASLGDVNLKSIEEYDRENERYQSLKDDYDSLVKDKEDIENLVKELSDKKKYALLKVYRAINDNFRKIYKEMSNGGDAYLILEDEENPFNGGLVIKVKPPGKGIKPLHALSGGEKSLTALAFIFAIQQYDPSPIYLLDEVDMFLDGVNSEILGRIIRRNASSAQFIVMSLRKATIKFADYIIGVANRGDGISRIYAHHVPEGVSENGQ